MYSPLGESKETDMSDHPFPLAAQIDVDKRNRKGMHGGYPAAAQSRSAREAVQLISGLIGSINIPNQHNAITFHILPKGVFILSRKIYCELKYSQNKFL